MASPCSGPAAPASLFQTTTSFKPTRRRHSEHSPIDGKPAGGLTLHIVTAVLDPQMRPSDSLVPADFLNFGPGISVVWPCAPQGRNAALGLGELRGLPWVSTPFP
jgi:hypothetical protein